MKPNVQWKTIAALTAAAAVLAFLNFSLVQGPAQRPLPVYGEVPPFRLTAADGNDFDSKDLAGRVWVADFIFTTCGSVCPVMSRNMAALHRSFALEDEVRFVSVSVNPEQDTPAVLAAYAEKYKAAPDLWIFLTGPRRDITALAARGFKLGSTDEPVFHSRSFSLVDRQGRIRGYYDGTDRAAVQDLFKDLSRLLQDPRT